MRSTDCVQVFVPVVCSFSGINVIMLCFKSYSKSYLALRFCLIKLNLVKIFFLPLKKNPKTNRISPNYFENYLKAFITHEIKKERIVITKEIHILYVAGCRHLLRVYLTPSFFRFIPQQHSTFSTMIIKVSSYLNTSL